MNKKSIYIGLGSIALLFTAAYLYSNQGGDILSQGSPISEEDRTYVAAPSIPTEHIYASPYWVHSVLSQNQEESSDYVIIECTDTSIEDSDSYLSSHIEGAYHLDINTLEDPSTGNVLAPELVSEIFSSYGITKHTTVIFYSPYNSDIFDERAATIALWLGVTNVKCLDGGINAYSKAGFPTESLVNTPVATETYFGLEVPGRPEIFSTQEDVLSQLDDEFYRMVSVRTYDEFRGVTSGSSRTKLRGEIEGAVWGRDTTDGTYSELDGTSIDLVELNRILIPYDTSTDDNHLTFYCIDGDKASRPFLIAYQGGATNISIYDGGWSEWVTNKENPVQVGEPLSIDIIHTTVSEL